MYKNAVYTPVNGVITHQKQQISKRWYCYLLRSTSTLRQCRAASYEFIAIFKALSYINQNTRNTTIAHALLLYEFNNSTFLCLWHIKTYERL